MASGIATGSPYGGKALLDNNNNNNGCEEAEAAADETVL